MHDFNECAINSLLPDLFQFYFTILSLAGPKSDEVNLKNYLSNVEGGLLMHSLRRIIQFCCGKMCTLHKHLPSERGLVCIFGRTNILNIVAVLPKPWIVQIRLFFYRRCFDNTILNYLKSTKLTSTF